MTALDPFVPGRLWLHRYPIHYAGTRFEARMTIVALASGQLLLHSPCAIDDALHGAIEAIGPVAHIVAPGNFHHLHVASAQAAFPHAKTWLCPGVEAKQPQLAFDGLLGDTAPPDWAGEIDQVLVRGSRWMWEVAFFDRASRTLVLVDLIENFTERTPGINFMLRFWMKLFGMWNRPKPAPEYQLGWRDRSAAAASLRRILAWDFERIVLSHGDLIERDARHTAERAWASILAA